MLFATEAHVHPLYQWRRRLVSRATFRDPLDISGVLREGKCPDGRASFLRNLALTVPKTLGQSQAGIQPDRISRQPH